MGGPLTEGEAAPALVDDGGGADIRLVFVFGAGGERGEGGGEGESGREDNLPL